MKKLKNGFLIFSLSLPLCGCMDVAMSGAQAAYNHKSLNSALQNHYLSMKTNQAIYWDTDKYKNTHVEVNEYADMVLITGQVTSLTQRNEVDAIIRKITNGSEVHNALEIRQPTTHLIRLSDAWTTAKVKAKFVASNNLDPDQIKIITENGNVFLIGLVFHDQADEAVQLARDTDGVKSVVKVFSYLTLSKT